MMEDREGVGSKKIVVGGALMLRMFLSEQS
jgi:hypothetical protein